MRPIPVLVACVLCVLFAPLSVLASTGAFPQAWKARTYVTIHQRTQMLGEGYSPAQIRHAYGLDQTANDGSGIVVGIVDAYHDPQAAANLATFSAAFKLPALNGTPGHPPCSVSAGPHPCLEIRSSSTKANSGWATETNLDLQWAHSAAPGSDILLVEAADASLAKLLQAVDVAQSSAKIVSMSWGGPEFSKEDQTGHLASPHIAYVAASGDSGHGPSFPAALDNVLAVGGTTLKLDAQGKRTSAETGWAGSGGGLSTRIKAPPYQAYMPNHAAHRSIPDVSLNSDPATGYAVYSDGYWLEVGGTSAATPQWAGMLAVAQQGSGHTPSLPDIYKAANFPGVFTDIHQGRNGPCKTACLAAAGYDMVTGLGTPLAGALFGKLK